MATYAFVPAAIDNSMTILDVTNPALPAFNSNLSGAGLPNYLGLPIDTYRLGSKVYVTTAGGGGDAGLTIIDISNINVPTFKGYLAIGSSLYQRYVFVEGRYAYCTDSTDFMVVDVNDPTAPVLKATLTQAQLGLSGTGMMGRPQKYGNYCFIHSAMGSGSVDNDNALIIIDVSNPLVPTVKGSLRGTANNIGGFWCFPEDDYVYCPCFLLNTLSIIDVSNKAAPSFKGKLSGDGAPNYLGGALVAYKVGNTCFVSCGCVGGGTPDLNVVAVDVTNKAAPSFISRLTGFSGGNLVLFVDGNVGYVSDPIGNAIYICNFSNPASMSILGSLSGAGLPNYLGTPCFIVTKEYPAPSSPDSFLWDIKGTLDCINWSRPI